MRRTLVLLGCLLTLAVPRAGLTAPVCIPGVKSMGWETKRWTQQIAALYSALDAMGCPMPYDELMVASGAAFCIAWQPGWYSYGAAQMAPEDLILNGARAAGAEAERPPLDSPQAVWQAICQSIDGGCPVVSWQGVGWASQVICGYDPQGQQLHIRDYHTQTEQYKVVPFESPGTPWPIDSKNDIVLIRYDPGQDPPELDWPQIIERAILFADWPADQPLGKAYAFGLPAYDAWAATLRQGLDRNGAETDVVLTEYMTRVITGARSAASVVLLDHIEVHEAFEDAATHYMSEAELLNTMAAVLSQGQGFEWNEIRQAMAANFPKQAVREEAAQLIELAMDEEMMAVDALRVALNDLKAQPVEPPTVGPTPVVETGTGAEQGPADTEKANQHCRVARQLKAQRRHREAAQELRAAIEADPNHVDAHYILAWVLIELKDTEGARTEFRKVIELAPGTDKAREAEKALKRLE